MLLLLLACFGRSTSPFADHGDTVRFDTARPDTSGRDTDPGDSDSADSDVHSSPPDSDSPADTGSGDTWRSSLYPEDWTPAFTAADGHFLHDFSYAGYRAGEAPLPDPLPGIVFDVTDFGADPTGATDSTGAVRLAITAASAAAPAVVTFPAGTFKFDDTLTISTSNVVLRGAGPAATFLYFTRTEGMSDEAHLTFEGTITGLSQHPLAADAEARAHDVVLTDATGVSVGDTVAVGWTISPEFIAEHGMTDVWVSFNDDHKTFFRRTVVAVAGNTVTLDAPLRYPAKIRDSAKLTVESGYLREVGVQGLAVSTVGDWDTAWSGIDRTHAIALRGVSDGWASDIASWESPLSTDGRGKHLMSGGIIVQDSRRVTLTHMTLQNAQNRGSNGNGYLFEVMRSNEVLTVDSTAANGRHNFIQNWDFGTSGCVWLRTISEAGRSYYADWDPLGWTSYSEFHHSLAMANLIDHSSATDGWQAVNRQDESSGAGHAATQTVWWNLSGGYLRSLQHGDGYVIGTTDAEVHTDPAEWDWNNAGEGTEPADWLEGEGLGSTLEPASLYEDQLARRLVE